MKTIILLMVLLITLSACEKEEELAPVVCYCTEMTYATWSQQGSIKYLYDDKNRMARMESYITNSSKEQFFHRYDTFEYDEKDNIIKNIAHNPNTGQWNVYQEVFYNNKGLLTERILYTLWYAHPIQNDVHTVTSYNYSPSSQLINSTVEYKDSDGGTSSYSYDYSADGTLTVQLYSYTRLNLGLREKTSNTFDGKAHPLSAVPAYLKYTKEEYGALPINHRFSNVLSSKFYENAGPISDANMREDITYDATFEYNLAGYPTKEVRKYKNGNSDIYTYTYTCR